MPHADVELVVNTYERTWERVLRPGFFAAIESQNLFPLARRVALINNVVDRRAVEERARSLVGAGEIDAYEFVEERLPQALDATGLSLEDLGRIRHYSDCSLVAVTLSGAPWLLYWDAEIELERPADWIAPSIDLMESDSRVLAANPNWMESTLEGETIERRDDFALGLGFSDQLYLVRRADLARPVYGARCVARLRYPMAHVAHVFEARVDAHIRHGELLRATYTKARYQHRAEHAGESYPPFTALERLRRKRNMAALAAVRASPLKRRCWRYM